MKTQSGRALPRLLGLVLMAFGLAVLLLGAYLVWNSLQARLALEAAAEGAADQAGLIEQQISSVRQAIQSEEFVALVAGSESINRDALVATLRSLGVGNVLNVVIARQAIEEVDLSVFPGSGFAALEMMLKARTEGSVPAQVHFAGAPDEYLAVAERLDSEDPRSAVALVTFPVSVLVNRVRRPEAVHAMSLVQVAGGQETTLEQFGSAVGTPTGQVPIAGSLFQLGWYRSSVIGPMSTMQLAGVAGIGLLLAVLGFMVTRRSRAVADGEQPDAAVADKGKPADGGEADVAPAPEPVRQRPKASQPAQPPAHERARRTEELDPETLEPIADSRSSSRGAPAADSFDDGPILEEDPLTFDGEPRRESAEQRNFEAPELGVPESAPGTTNGPGEDQPEAGEDDDFLFDPDAPADDQSDISLMLQSLVEDDEPDEQGASEPVAPQVADAPEPAPVDAEPTPPVVPPASIFRAYDIRGVVGDTLSAEIAEAIGRSVGSEARSKGLNRIAVARDGRLSGAELLAALSRGLVAAGVDVIDVGAVPTPVLYYAAQELGGGSGVMVTGSHNPPDYNGFKIVLGGESLSGERITALHTRLADGDLESGKGQISQQRITVQYIERIGTDIQLEKPLKVVADCGNGIAGAVAPRLLEAIGAEVIPLYAEVDGTFPNHHPDPGDPATLEDLRLCVRNFNADIGVAFDGDGDRLGVVAPDGEIIYPDRLMMLFARDVLSRNPGQPIIFDVKCSGLLAGEIEKAGGKPIMARTGHSFIKEQLKRDRAPLAGEMSGHFFFAERWFGFDDGMYAAARLLEILAADTRAPGQILAALPKAESTPELKVEMKEGEPHPFVEEFARTASFEGAEINSIDGVRADFKDGFGLVRASNTTPVLVLRFEGKDKKALTRIQQLFRKAMLEVNPALKLPF
ncbi:MAG: hypothetical protein WD397_02475 [Wenzhouxiangellaceae bacterium]